MVYTVIEGNTLEESASHWVNPASVLCIMDEVKKAGNKAIIHSAGSSSLGKMLIRVCKAEGVKLINFVRKAE